MMYEVRNSHDDVIFKNENKEIAIIHCNYLSEANRRLTYRVVEVKEIYRVV